MLDSNAHGFFVTLLDLADTDLTDLGMVHDMGCSILATLENLSSLNLSQNERITNRGAAALAALTNLKTLNLSNTRVNSNALMSFRGLVKLKSLALYGCLGI